MASNAFFHISIALLVLVALVFLNGVGVVSPALDWGRLIVGFLDRPFVAVFAKANDFFEIVSQIKSLHGENRNLTNQVSVLTSELAALEKADQENRVLREALHFQTQDKARLISAQVIFLDPLDADKKITINRGKADGVTEGDPVVVSESVLVGTITSAFEHTSQLELITAASMTVNAQTSTGRARGVVRGEHNLGLLMDLIAQNETVVAGDKVITSGLGGLFPAGLLIGRVGDIRSNSSELFQKASVIPAANFRDLEFVFVIKR